MTNNPKDSNNGLELKMMASTNIHSFGKGKDTTNSNNANSGGGGGINPLSIASQQTVHGAVQNDDLDILINYNDLASNGEFTEAFFRESQIEQVLNVLDTMKKPNAVLTGEAGVGKTQIVEEIARRLVNGDPIVNGKLKGVTIYELPLGKIVSGSKYVGQLEEKLYDVVDFASNVKNNAVIFIDEIHQIMGGSSSNPTYDKIAQIIKPALGRGALRVIGATTTQEAVSFMSDPAFSRRWSTVQVPELSPDETVQILLNIRDSFQNHHGVVLADNIVKDVVSIGDEYKQYGSHRPDSAITLLDKSMSDAKTRRLKQIEHAKKDPNMQLVINAQPRPVISLNQLRRSALTLLTGDDKMFEQNVSHLEDILEERIIGQSSAKQSILDAVRRLSLRLTKRVRPTSFLFAGPSGTGKTEVAKQVAEAVFGSKDRMIYINMSEFTSPHSMSRITGSSEGYIGSDSKRELPFDSLENNPYQLILLDEFEKAHTDVQRFFMQALDEGIVKTNRNKEIDFTRTIFIATTNAGVEDLGKKHVGFSGSVDAEHSTQDVISALKTSFDVELINRFEKLIAFTSINESEYMKILAVKYNQIITEAQENRNDLLLQPDSIDIDTADTNDVLIELTEKSYTPASNGRPAERTMRNYIEDVIIDSPNNTTFTLL